LIVSELGHSASPSGHGGDIQGSESGHHQHDDRHQHGAHDAHAPEHNMKAPTVFAVLVAATLSSSSITLLATSGYERWVKKKEHADQEQLAAHDQVAKAWREQLQTNVFNFPFSPRAADRIGSLQVLSRNSNPKIACIARLRLSTAYFITRQFEKADAELGTAEAKCANDDELMEELHYLHGRTNGEIAKEKEFSPDIRRAYESLAWKNYNESWRYRRQQKDFAAVNVLQMCILSLRRSDITTAELRDLQARLNEITSDPIVANLAARNGLMTYVITQEKIMAPMLASMESKEEKKPATATLNLQMHIDPLQAPTGPTKSLQNLFAHTLTDKPAVTRKPAATHKPDRTRKRARRD
jgi:hypothetical protein